MKLAGGASAGTEELEWKVISTLLLQTFGESEDQDKWAITRFPVLRKVLGLKWELSVYKDGTTIAHLM
jgi:hypothetical protein